MRNKEDGWIDRGEQQVDADCSARAPRHCQSGLTAGLPVQGHCKADS